MFLYLGSLKITLKQFVFGKDCGNTTTSLLKIDRASRDSLKIHVFIFIVLYIIIFLQLHWVLSTHLLPTYSDDAFEHESIFISQGK